MTDNNQTSQPAQQLNHREEVLKDFPEAFCAQGERPGELLILSRAGTIGRSFNGEDDAWASVQLTATPAPQSAPEPVDQGEQQSSDNAAPAGTQINVPSCWPAPAPSPGPSEPEVPPMDDETMAMAEQLCDKDDPSERDPKVGGPWERLAAALRENQQLRQRIDEFSAIYEKCASDLEREFERAEKLQQQLAQIKAYKGERPDYFSFTAVDVNKVCRREQVEEILDKCDATFAALRLQLEKLQKRFDSAWDHIAATSIALDTPVGMNNADYAAQLKLDNAQKDKRIAELEGGK